MMANVTRIAADVLETVSSNALSVSGKLIQLSKWPYQWSRRFREDERRIHVGSEWFLGLIAVAAFTFAVLSWLREGRANALAEKAVDLQRQGNLLNLMHMCRSEACASAASVWRWL